MYVLTADQIDSRHHADAVGGALARLEDRYGTILPLPPERTAGDELQLVTASADVALSIVLDLTRVGDWSVGLGIGRATLGAHVRASTGDAFVAARRAVERAKKKPSRTAIDSEPPTTDAQDLDALLDLLLLTRGRRSDEGWELADLLDRGLSQAAAAATLGISPQAASDRAQAAALKQDRAATEAIGRLLARWEEP
jgi:hypothetical protein